MAGAAILLAAGFSRRFGSDKRRHVLEGGQSLLSRSVALYARAFCRLIVVLRPEDDDLAEQALAAAPDHRVEVVRCADASAGMGHSLACGARAGAGSDYLFVALADMAWVRPETLQRLRLALQQAPDNAIVQPVYRDQPGHPVGFGAAHLAALAELQGDEGARSILHQAADVVQRLSVDDPGVLEDLDQPP